ncbi:tRNA and rRNA cytosine-C5-methylase [Streptococcus sp. DD10]|nr:tRNA and rRNA cytosine-C5-methylase [Streptococcus sp. DD10]
MIVLDAPCSGEGMFRKQPDATQYWSEDYPSQCAALQKDILKAAIPMLKKGSELIYSTCTWSPEENEEIVSWLLEEYDFELIPIAHINGMSDGIGFPETARMYSHHFRGEGQFIAHFRYNGESKIGKAKTVRSNLTLEQKSLWEDFMVHHLNVKLTGTLQTFGEQLYLLPEGLPDMSKLKIARNGLHLGTFKKKRFEPSFALGLALKPSQVKATVSISDIEFEHYARGETISLVGNLSNGWYQVLAKGNGLGFAKVTGNILKNYFPKGLRFK